MKGIPLRESPTQSAYCSVLERKLSSSQMPLEVSFESNRTHHLATFLLDASPLTFIQFCTSLGLNHEYAVGDIVVINDHLFLAGLAGNHPLRGPNLDIFGARFPPLSDAYDLSLRRVAHVAWKKGQTDGKGVKQRRLHEGVYAFVAGPSFETRAECRMLRMLGADLVGMSTVPEIIVARHCGLRVLALSLVTNNAVLDPGPRGDDPLLEGATVNAMRMIVEKGRANHEEVVEEGRLAALDLQVKTTCLLVVRQVVELS
jgi:purine-nucleoside phosphorylase